MPRDMRDRGRPADRRGVGFDGTTAPIPAIPCNSPDFNTGLTTFLEDRRHRRAVEIAFFCLLGHACVPGGAKERKEHLPEDAIPLKRMGIRHAKPHAEKHVTFRFLPERHLSVI
jgi:hypothetical protein